MTTNKKLTRQRINSDPAFARTRENAAEFGRAVKAMKLLKTAFRDLVLITGDTTIHKRLQKQTMRMLQTDPANVRGQRSVAKGDQLILKGFEFNSGNPFKNILYNRFAIQIDRTTGNVTFMMPQFIPNIRIDAPPGTSHFQFMIMAATLDFDNNSYEQAVQETAPLPWDRHTTKPISMVLPLPSNSTQPIMVALGLVFGQSVNNRLYPSGGASQSAAAIVEVDEP